MGQSKQPVLLDGEAWVIQGSVLGSIMLLIFISDINTYILPTIQFIKYLDDLGTLSQSQDLKDDYI